MRERLLENLIKWLRDYRFPAPRQKERTVEGYAEDGEVIGNWYGVEEAFTATPDNQICLVEGKAPNESPAESGYTSSRRVIQVVCRSKTLITAKIRCQRIEEIVRQSSEITLDGSLVVVKVMQKPIKSGIDANGRFHYSVVLSVFADRGVS